MKAKRLDKKFDEREDITKYLDVSKAHRPEQQQQRRVNVDFPVWMIHSLDKEAKRLGVPGQSIIKVWVAERLKEDEEEGLMGWLHAREATPPLTPASS